MTWECQLPSKLAVLKTYKHRCEEEQRLVDLCRPCKHWVREFRHHNIIELGKR